jgi:hypothetical protein
MERTRVSGNEYWSLVALLLLVAAVCVSAVTSCGGGGSSNGGLCEQCGVSPDGPCQKTAFVVPGATEPQPCPSVDSTNPNGCVSVDLICRRKVDSAQQRCYPVDTLDPKNPDFNFRCDGSRPGGTAIPRPTLTPTAISSPTSTKTPDASASCGDGIIEGLEDCDGDALDDKSCDDFCDSDAGTLVCAGDCAFDTSQCTGGNCEVP